MRLGDMIFFAAISALTGCTAVVQSSMRQTPVPSQAETYSVENLRKQGVPEEVAKRQAKCAAAAEKTAKQAASDRAHAAAVNGALSVASGFGSIGGGYGGLIGTQIVSATAMSIQARAEGRVEQAMAEQDCYGS